MRNLFISLSLLVLISNLNGQHAKNIHFKNVRLSLREPDAREMIITEDVEGFVFEEE
jgi:hypothetical protein